MKEICVKQNNLKKSWLANQHPRNKNGQFTEKYESRSPKLINKVIKNFVKNLPKETKKEVENQLKTNKFVKVEKNLFIEKERYKKYFPYSYESINEKSDSDTAIFQKEYRIAKVLAENGFPTHMLKNGNHQDFIISKMFFDYKNVRTNMTAAENTELYVKKFLRAVQDNYRLALTKNNSNGTVYYIKENAITEEALMRAMKGLMIQHIKNGKDIEKYDGLALMYFSTKNTFQCINLKKLRNALEKENQRLETKSSRCTGRMSSDTRSESLPTKNSISQKSLVGSPTINSLSNYIKKSSGDFNNVMKNSNLKSKINKNEIDRNLTLEILNITNENKAEKIGKIENLFKHVIKYQDVEKAATELCKRQITEEEYKENRKKNDFNKSDYNCSILIKHFLPNEINRLNKALRNLSLTFEVPVGEITGESFVYKAQEELVRLFSKDFTEKTRNIYEFVCDYFDLTKSTLINKAILKHKGIVIYSPETGKPLTTQDFNNFVKNLEKFLNRNYNGIGERLILSSEILGRLLDRMSKTQNLDSIRKMTLEDISKNKKIDWINSDIKQLKNIVGENLSRTDFARIQVASQSAAQKIASITDSEKNNIQQIILDGIKNHESKSKVSQNLFDKCARLNRDFNKIADTEIQNNSNNAYIQEEVFNSDENEKVYFKRIEVVDEFTCKKCKSMNESIALWSDKVLNGEEIDDEYTTIAIWEGKNDFKFTAPNGAFHPYCRGVWVRYYPDIEFRKSNNSKTTND